MKLISDIINELMDFDKPISSPLLKTKVLASRIGSENLINWVNGELNGYENEHVLPDYRKTYGMLMGNYLNGKMKVTNTTIPVAHLSKTEVETLTAIELKESISSVERFITQKGIKISVNAHAKLFLEKSIQSQGNFYFQILSVNLEMPASFLTDIISNVRSKLLDFMLELENKFGHVTEIQDLKAKQSVINNIMNSTINNNGDGNIINSGDNTKISATISITKGNKDLLEKTLQENGVVKEDVTELMSVIDTEEPTENGFGVKVNSWFQKMLAKSLDSTWKIGIGAAGTLLAEALKAYYGS
ncbi:hypothetical protein [Pedobacter sp. L105]|uniref:AbiTii domain-containing protein n=1 Tax=Pedobacter sp. L105 TaxID=1641871 RepID=UPI00131E97FF|nr:hypothetical protein [Pedobacter sp. L105]